MTPVSPEHCVVSFSNPNEVIGAGITAAAGTRLALNARI